MVRFAHLADCHLGSWRQPELQQLNFLSFSRIVDDVLSWNPDFILIAGDLFDSAYPPIEVLKDSFEVFKKIHDVGVPVYLIAGSHDFSASGKTFLDVLEKAGFCKNVEDWEEVDGKLVLKPTLHGDIAIYGYPGRKSSMEVADLRRVVFDGVHATNIFMIHTTIRDVLGSLPVDAVDKESLPAADYVAMGHIHKRFEVDHRSSKFVYPGPTFPCNFQELSDLKHGSYRLVEMDGGRVKSTSVELPLRDVVVVNVELENALTGTQEIISSLDRHNFRGKVVLLKLGGVLKQGKTGDINFLEIEDFVRKKEAFVFLRNISSLKLSGSDVASPVRDGEGMASIEKRILGEYSSSNPAQFNKFLPALMNLLSLEKSEEEKSSSFEDRLVSEVKDALELRELL